MSRLLFILLAYVLCLPAYAHPGHDLMQHGASHVATSPYHLAFLGFVSFVSLGIAAFARTRRLQVILCGTAVFSLLAVAALWILRS